MNVSFVSPASQFRCWLWLPRRKKAAEQRAPDRTRPRGTPTPDAPGQNTQIASPDTRVPRGAHIQARGERFPGLWLCDQWGLVASSIGDRSLALSPLLVPPSLLSQWRTAQHYAQNNQQIGCQTCRQAHTTGLMTGAGAQIGVGDPVDSGLQVGFLSS